MADEARSSRRRVLSGLAAAGGGLILAGCRGITETGLSQTVWFPKLLETATGLNMRVQRLLAGSWSLAQEYPKSDISAEFKANGTLDPGTPAYQAMAANGFRDWRIPVVGLVARPFSMTVADLRAFPSRTQITRHDCVEGWSCIGEWTGTPLSVVLQKAQPLPEARYVVFYCADPMPAAYDNGNTPYYYESLDLIEANHPQTILAYAMNGQPLAIPHGAPVRLRCERQLGYKHAKYVERIELVKNFDHIGGGKGGYWEDQGYAWWAGI
jgi:DMSO/TMAO reductase YedYZ molybdopterin-dependent catalytic subunit